MTANWLVNTSTPKIIIRIPKTTVAYFRCLDILETKRFACEINPPMMINGIPSPNEYARSRLKEMLGAVAANVRIEPNIGPTHGVHPPANASP